MAIVLFKKKLIFPPYNYILKPLQYKGRKRNATLMSQSILSCIYNIKSSRQDRKKRQYILYKNLLYSNKQQQILYLYYKPILDFITWLLLKNIYLKISSIWAIKKSKKGPPKSLLKPLQKIQTACLWSITGGYKRTATVLLEKEANIPPL